MCGRVLNFFILVSSPQAAAVQLGHHAAVLRPAPLSVPMPVLASQHAALLEIVPVPAVMPEPARMLPALAHPTVPRVPLPNWPLAAPSNAARLESAVARMVRRVHAVQTAPVVKAVCVSPAAVKLAPVLIASRSQVQLASLF